MILASHEIRNTVRHQIRDINQIYLNLSNGFLVKIGYEIHFKCFVLIRNEFPTHLEHVVRKFLISASIYPK